MNMFVDQEVVRKDKGIHSKSFAVWPGEDITSNDRRSGIDGGIKSFACMYPRDRLLIACWRCCHAALWMRAD